MRGHHRAQGGGKCPAAERNVFGRSTTTEPHGQLRLARRQRRNHMVGGNFQNIWLRQGPVRHARHGLSTHSSGRSCARETDHRPRVQRRQGFRSRISTADARRLGQTCPCHGACGNGCIGRHRVCWSGNGCHCTQASRGGTA